MALVLDDLLGLNGTSIEDMPVLQDAAHASRLLAASPNEVLSIAGMRHSQGGHTVVDHGRVLLTMAKFNRIELPIRVVGKDWAATVKVEAGATWSELHRVLGPLMLAPMVQQSSAAFTIGGSLSVNCHGRDPRWGPVSASVEEITVLTASRGVLSASRTQNEELFYAALGGYSACGMILDATLRVVDNDLLMYVGDTRTRGLDECQQRLLNLPADPDVHLHYSWLCCVPYSVYSSALITDFRKIGGPQKPGSYAEQEWGEDELLRAGWSSARDHLLTRLLVWEELCERHLGGHGTPKRGTKGSSDNRINWLRSATSFISYRGTESAEILQEYFVPVERLEEMLARLKSIFRRGSTNVLSTTIRLVRQDAETVLSYCADGSRACIAIEAMVPVAEDGSGRLDLSRSAKADIESAIQAALDLKGSFYLPYFKVADLKAFHEAYPRHALLQAAIDIYNPKQADGRHRFWNTFLDRYFD
ncbi:MAG: FAD-binding protein [Pseudomonadota bacterium]|nr:FAD-binding protein [Pseudomonadota bacterium]